MTAAEFRRSDRTGEALLVVLGEIDLSNADDFRAAMQALLGEGRTPALVDLSGITFIDSTGMAALVAARETADAAGIELVLVDPSPQARMVLEVTNLWTHFKTRP
ncbi:MAG TPA: STAS domain-containing protein [Acidimicrobiia bacterium]